jgi:hypothetical protein
MRGGTPRASALFPHPVPPPVPLGHRLLRREHLRHGHPTTNRTRDPVTIGSAFRVGIERVRRLSPCDLGNDNSSDKRGVSNPRTGSGAATLPKQGGCSRPDPLSTVTRDGRRAAQNAARMENDGHLQLASAQSLACRAMQSLPSSRPELIPRLSHSYSGDNHGVLSRLPSRRQQFDPSQGQQGHDHVALGRCRPSSRLLRSGR